MPYRIAGAFLGVFGWATLIGSVVAACILDALFIDLLAVAVVILAPRVYAGERGAAQGSLAVMLVYLLGTPAIIVGALFWPGSLRVGGRPLSAGELPWALMALAAAGTWSAVTVAFLLRALRSPRPSAAV